MPTEARYPAIVADLRDRIARGELAPGAKVPSTRRIAAEWGVAMATAARALAALAQEGLVRAEPRSGTVVAEPRRASPTRPRPAHVRPPELTRERVVRAAIAIADAEGLDALTMRGVAARLGVAAMSPYRHVAGKDELVLLMADAAFGERGYPARPPDGWRARLELCARTLWSLYRRHPWLAQLSPITRPLPLPNLAVHAEWALAALDGFGLGAAALCDLHVMFFSHVHGIAIHLERERHALGASGLSEDEWMDTQAPAMAEIVGSGRYPTFARMLTSLSAEGYDLDLDELFELGLRSMLDGLALRLERL
ncbi:TetR/AcrR family transcriptional regulator C-terminal domain-containing protein [Saccharothrix sp. S26]|uniref:TetR/AcrR family transcriptional regulator C-terminal domain-containing protein n=1 Tax=Saccharothrix sp. S26 TaxID=2907215 RepID=UPI001F422939|nr:TetR/AcrR family transcriptional regulator C-terminal domain-containing protein [Saccharothrix sp. S26]MCE7000367.1 TetR/AcrR family transcriptional regulator C-terminal domain-containing protein [Saccharothrix sp. S26]